MNSGAELWFQGLPTEPWVGWVFGLSSILVIIVGGITAPTKSRCACCGRLDDSIWCDPCLKHTEANSDRKMPRMTYQEKTGAPCPLSKKISPR